MVQRLTASRTQPGEGNDQGRSSFLFSVESGAGATRMDKIDLAL